MPLFTEISDPARCARSHLVVSLIEEQTLYQCIRDQYQDQQSIFTLPWVAQLCIKLVALFVFLCYPKMIGFHSKTFSGETEKETVWIKNIEVTCDDNLECSLNPFPADAQKCRKSKTHQGAVKGRR